MTEKVTTVTNLWHLEGKTVTVFADGNRVSDAVVVDGQITLERPASKILVGLPIQSYLQTLNIDTGDPTTQGKPKNIAALTVKVNDTRGLQVGRTFDTLVDFKVNDYFLAANQPIPLESGEKQIVIDPLWDSIGQLAFKQDEPLPVTILAVIPELAVGGDKSRGD